jgi:hypothetical protein
LKLFGWLTWKDYRKKRLDKEWEFQEEQYGASSKGQEEKQPKPSAKEDLYTSFRTLLKAAQNHDAVFIFLEVWRLKQKSTRNNN